ncbi:MAG: radical SAM protein [Candidatus Eiseniibacteriota bacterium]|nr:MAG: radical SAM protein [Candidatus Eisenbacteria bacterium]
MFCFIMAGGEPFLFPRLVELCRESKDRFFLIFTNGTALEASDYERLRSLTNTGVIVSIEGGPELTDSRRGPGVYSQALDTLKRLEDIGVLSGVSVTIDRRNFGYWMNDGHVDALIAEGVRFGFFIEYIPSSPAGESSESENSTQAAPSCANAPSYLDELSQGIAGDDHLLMLTSEERASFRQQILRWRSEKSIYLIHSPGDEEFFGGCVSAGRGFAHVTPAGDVTPCPVSNVATHNLFDTSLKEALASPLFEQIRENEDLLETGDTPCGLFAHPKEVERLAKAVGAYRTDARE